MIRNCADDTKREIGRFRTARLDDQNLTLKCLDCVTCWCRCRNNTENSRIHPSAIELSTVDRKSIITPESPSSQWPARDGRRLADRCVKPTIVSTHLSLVVCSPWTSPRVTSTSNSKSRLYKSQIANRMCTFLSLPELELGHPRLTWLGALPSKLEGRLLHSPYS